MLTLKKSYPFIGTKAPTEHFKCPFCLHSYDSSLESGTRTLLNEETYILVACPECKGGWVEHIEARPGKSEACYYHGVLQDPQDPDGHIEMLRLAGLGEKAGEAAEFLMEYKDEKVKQAAIALMRSLDMQFEKQDE